MLFIHGNMFDTAEVPTSLKFEQVLFMSMSTKHLLASCYSKKYANGKCSISMPVGSMCRGYVDHI